MWTWSISTKLRVWILAILVRCSGGGRGERCFPMNQLIYRLSLPGFFIAYRCLDILSLIVAWIFYRLSLPGFFIAYRCLDFFYFNQLLTGELHSRRGAVHIARILAVTGWQRSVASAQLAHTARHHGVGFVVGSQRQNQLHDALQVAVDNIWMKRNETRPRSFPQRQGHGFRNGRKNGLFVCLFVYFALTWCRVRRVLIGQSAQTH